MIRPATLADMERILEIYDCARGYMRRNGNMNQWIGGYPSRELLSRDIANGNLYVMVEDRIFSVFALIGGEDPTYAFIDGGTWRSDSPYGTVHRLASDGSHSGVLKLCLDFALKQFDHVRADTHHDNHPMQKALSNNGFSRRGVIYLENGDPRVAYDYLIETPNSR